MNNNIEKLSEEENFEIEKSPLKEAYLLLDVRTPLELSHLYTEEDQKLMRSRAWDYKNPDLVVNKVEDILEQTDPRLLTEGERKWRQEILWFWYHHAISCAIWRYKDKETAKYYTTKAIEYQSADHPNKITNLLYLLVHDKLEEAEKWQEMIEIDYERETAAQLLKEYKEGKFFEKSG